MLLGRINDRIMVENMINQVTNQMTNQMTNIESAKEILSNGDYTCVLCKGEQIYTSKQRGVKPLVIWYNDDKNYEGFSAADKVVGRATAFLYVLIGIREVYARVISRQALDVLKREGIIVEYETLVDNIINREGDGICPFEKTVLEVNDAKEAFERICLKMKEMNIKI